MLICAHRMMRRRPIGNSSVVPIQPVLRRLTWPLDEAQESTSPMHKSQKEDTTMGLVPRRSSMLHTSLGFVDSKSAGFRITQTGSGHFPADPQCVHTGLDNLRGSGAIQGDMALCYQTLYLVQTRALPTPSSTSFGTVILSLLGRFRMMFGF